MAGQQILPITGRSTVFKSNRKHGMYRNTKVKILEKNLREHSFSDCSTMLSLLANSWAIQKYLAPQKKRPAREYTALTTSLRSWGQHLAEN